MKPEEQRMVISKACGYTHLRNSLGLPNCYLPDYPNDLNAMYEAEKTLDEPHRLQYQCELGGYPFDNYNWYCLHVNAAQRAEAFLKTLGLWKEL